MNVTVSGIGSAVQFLVDTDRAIDKAGIGAANKTALSVRAAMQKEGQIGQTAFRVLRAKDKKPEAVVSSRTWTLVRTFGYVSPYKGERYGSSDSSYAIPSTLVKGGGKKKADVAAQYGFRAIMKSGKYGIFMREGKARLGVDLLFTLKDPGQVREIEAAGVKRASKRFRDFFDEVLIQNLGKVL